MRMIYLKDQDWKQGDDVRKLKFKIVDGELPEGYVATIKEIGKEEVKVEEKKKKTELVFKPKGRKAKSAKAKSAKAQPKD